MTALAAAATIFASAAWAAESMTPLDGKAPAPDFTLPDVDGNAVRLSDFRGKVVIVNFWATWCPPCRFEMPSLQRAWEKLKDDGGVVIAVHVGGKEDEVWQFMSSYDLSFPIVLDTDSSVIKAWPVKGLPTTLVVDPEGLIRYRAIGGREWDDPAILDAVRALK
jgi:peroxiredoxin